MTYSARVGTAVLLAIAVLFSATPAVASEPENIKYTEEYNTLLEIQETLSVEAAELEDYTCGEDYVENEAFFSANSLKEAKNVADSYGAELSSWSDGIAIIEFDKDVRDALKEASEEEDIKTPVVPNYYLEIADYAYKGSLQENDELEIESTMSVNDPDFSQQWHHTKINSEAAWKITKGSGAKVAVIDNGFEADHEDLVNNVVKTYSVSDGRADVSPSEKTKDEQKSHGTHVAGLIAAELNNETDGCGVAPEASLYLIKVSDSEGKMTIANLVKAINKASEWDVEVINISLGSSSIGLSSVRLLQNAIDRAHEAGAVVMCAAGNASSGSGVDTEFYPAACDNTIAVAAIDTNNGLASYSYYGEWVDVAAPGSNIYSCYADNDFGAMSGTSMATPIVSGVAALIYARNSALIDKNTSDSAEEVSEKLLSTTDGVEYSSSASGGTVRGCVDAFSALESETSSVTKQEPAFYVKTSSGFVTSGGSYWITPGKSIKLTIVDSNGKKIKGASSKNASSFESTNTSDYKIRNNKITCLKTAGAYSAAGTAAYSKASRTIVTVNYNNSSIKLKFVALAKIKKISNADGSKKGSESITVSQGTSLRLNNISDICGTDLYYFDGSNALIGSIDDVGYVLSLPKKAVNNGMITYDGSGNPITFAANKKGSYIFKIAAPAGIKKKFNVKVKVV